MTFRVLHLQQSQRLDDVLPAHTPKHHAHTLWTLRAVMVHGTDDDDRHWLRRHDSTTQQRHDRHDHRHGVRPHVVRLRVVADGGHRDQL